MKSQIRFSFKNWFRSAESINASGGGDLVDDSSKLRHVPPLEEYSKRFKFFEAASRTAVSVESLEVSGQSVRERKYPPRDWNSLPAPVYSQSRPIA